ncbi:MAG: adenosylcobinamide-GDP ribazoletransferase [Anaerolineae bacterium]|nr:adenosylcobinamide-GDP ribazoletransferase [Caldilineales bacterium]MDW8268390.1 adenosylcobinamide-GDP ribazoletransferase [Anaerolineae bacterium]
MIGRSLRGLAVALGLLTTLPMPLPAEQAPGAGGRAAAWFPLVGALIGGVTWLTWLGAARVLPPEPAAVMALLVWVGLTGGLHLDGLADCGDALAAAVPRERRLDILRDPRLGTFGAISLIAVILLKATLLMALTPARGLALVLAASLARGCVLPVGLAPPARPEGMAADFALGLRPRSLLPAAMVPLALAAVMGPRGLAALVAGLIVTAGVIALARRRLGGVTGDVMGMTVELVETVVLLVAVLAMGFGG